jgi:hypothetical protein
MNFLSKLVEDKPLQVLVRQSRPLNSTTLPTSSYSVPPTPATPSTSTSSVFPRPTSSVTTAYDEFIAEPKTAVASSPAVRSVPATSSSSTQDPSVSFPPSLIHQPVAPLRPSTTVASASTSIRSIVVDPDWLHRKHIAHTVLPRSVQNQSGELANKQTK